MKEIPPDEICKEKITKKRQPSAGQVSRRTFLGNLATVGIATTAGPLLQTEKAYAQPAVETTEEAEATTAGTVPFSLKINGQRRAGVKRAQPASRTLLRARAV